MNYRRWLIVGYMLVLMAFTTSVLLIPGEKYDTLTTSDSGWVYDTAVEIDNTNALAENNPLSHAPYGLRMDISEQIQPLVTVMLYRGVSTINPSVTLMDVVKYYAPLIFVLSLIPIFLIGKELGGNVGGIAAAFFAATLASSIYWHKVGAYDREPIQLILGAWAIFLTIKLFKAPRRSIPKFALLAGMVYGLFGLAWAGWHYVIAIMVLGLLIVLVVGFLGRFIRKTSDLFGAFFSTIRGHLGLLVGVLGTMVVITVVLGVLGGKSPEFWVGVFGAYTGYLGLGGGGGGGVSFGTYASEMQTPSSWGDTLSKFYGAEILTMFILVLIGIALAKFLWSRKRWELLTFSWLIVLMAMVWPGGGQARFERMWWPFVPVLAGVGIATLVSLVRRLSSEPSVGEWLKHFQNPLVLLLVIGSIVVFIAVPFADNAYDTAYNTTPPTEWHGVSALDKGFMEAFGWIRENTFENSVVSIQWSFGHLFTGATRRATVCDGAEIRAEEGKWEDDPSYTPRPPDYIYRVEDTRGQIYGMDISAEPNRINGRRIDVQRFPRMDENEFRWIVSTYRDNYNCKIDYVIFDYTDYCGAWWGQLNRKSTNSLQTVGSTVVFSFDGGQDNIALDLSTGEVYREINRTREDLWGYSVVLVDRNGNTFLFDRYGGLPFWMDGDGRLRVIYVVDVGERLGDHLFRQYQTPSIQDALTIFYVSPYDKDDSRFWEFKDIQIGGAGLTTLETQQLAMGIRVFEEGLVGIDYLENVFTSSNNRVKIFEVYHVPSPISPADGAMINDNTPEFRWSGAVGASRYELWMDNNADLSSPEIQVDNLVNTTYTAVVTLPDGDYFWRIGAYDSENDLLGWSDISTFTIDTQVPGQPQLSEPQDNAEFSTLEATFRWTEPEPGVTYCIQIDDENGFTPQYVHDNADLTDNSYTYTFQRNGVYYWRVRATDAAGNASEWSSTFTLTIRAPPQAPTLSTPENGASTGDNTPTLEWAGGNGDNYRLLLDDDSDFSSPNENRILAQSDTSYTIAAEDALSDGTYSWKVVAVVGDTENSSEVWTFTVDTVAPEAPTLYAPENGVETSDSTPTLEWSPSPGAENYRLLVDENSEFGSPDIDNLQPENTYTSTIELPDDNYYWKVIAIDAAGNENESPVWVFTVAAGGT